jgi:hypothetical protein
MDERLAGIFASEAIERAKDSANGVTHDMARWVNGKLVLSFDHVRAAANWTWKPEPIEPPPATGDEPPTP